MAQHKEGILFLVGGRAGEHEISLISGKHILKALDRQRFEPLVLVIHKNSEIHLILDKDLLRLGDKPNEISTPQGKRVAFYPYAIDGEFFIEVEGQREKFEKVFPVLHGPGGEDGTVQGLFELGQIPLVGCGVVSSAVCSEKTLTKKLLDQAGLPITPFYEVQQGGEIPHVDFDFPVFVKPNAMGSSVGVSKVEKPEDLSAAVNEALAYDDVALIEKAISGRELEIAVLESKGELKVSPLGEIKMGSGFYSYEAKYLDDAAVELILPASIREDLLEQAQDLARRAFRALQCRGMARVDFFLTSEDHFVINEVNTIPGFTPISMYPKLMGLSGLSYSDLITALIENAA